MIIENHGSAAFPEDFMFQLSKEEVPQEFLKSKKSTLNEQGKGADQTI